MYFKKPLLVSPDTDMHKESGKYSYPLNFDEGVNLDGLYEWYTSICPDEYDSFADGYIQKVFEINKLFEKKLIKVLTDNEKTIGTK